MRRQHGGIGEGHETHFSHSHAVYGKGEPLFRLRFPPPELQIYVACPWRGFLHKTWIAPVLIAYVTGSRKGTYSREDDS
jgi:hypothetical protein